MQTKKIIVSGITIYLSKRKKQRNLRLRVDDEGLVHLSVPFFVSEKKALTFAQENLDWIIKQQNQREKILFQTGSCVSILGKDYIIRHDKNQKTGIVIKEKELIVGGEEDFLHRRIVNFSKKELLKYIYEKAFCMAGIIDKKINKITLKDISTRWGSCSSKGNLNFCFKIAFAPLFVIDYLIAHEVSHLKEMNHSDRFWETVALMNVEQAKAEIWLRKNGRSLLQIK